jgi:pimeloyl-ACP methyl ester carboxylesterase
VPPQFLELKEGGRIAWEETGARDGTPLLFFHGWPASRLQGSGFSTEARELGIRIISPDRPGIGLSTFQADRQLLDWPPVVEQIADHLELDRFRILAISGGGPYAFASAWALKDRIIGASVVSGAPPLPPDTDPSELFAIYRWMLSLYRLHPGAIRLLFKCARPFATIRPPRWLWPVIVRCTSPSDAATLNRMDVFEGSFQCYAESWRTSGLGVAADGEIYAEPWGFDPAEVTTPIQLWHGKDDRNFHWRLAEKLAAMLPKCELRLLENEGHYSLPLNQRRAILEALCSGHRYNGQ